MTARNFPRPIRSQLTADNLEDQEQSRSQNHDNPSQQRSPIFKHGHLLVILYHDSRFHASTSSFLPSPASRGGAGGEVYNSFNFLSATPTDTANSGPVSLRTSERKAGASILEKGLPATTSTLKFAAASSAQPLRAEPPPTRMIWSTLRLFCF